MRLSIYWYVLCHFCLVWSEPVFMPGLVPVPLIPRTATIPTPSVDRMTIIPIVVGKLIDIQYCVIYLLLIITVMDMNIYDWAFRVSIILVNGREDIWTNSSNHLQEAWRAYLSIIIWLYTKPQLDVWWGRQTGHCERKRRERLAEMSLGYSVYGCRRSW